MIQPTAKDIIRARRIGFHANGSTFSPDHICGVEIGRTPEDFWEEFLCVMCLPANRHDFRFFVGGSEGGFIAANAEFWSFLVQRIMDSEDLWGPRWIFEPVAIQIAGIYHQQVTMHGASHFRWLEEQDFDWLAKGLPKPPGLDPSL